MLPREYWRGPRFSARVPAMKHLWQSPWAVAGLVLALALAPVLAALSVQRRQARAAEALLLERSTEVLAGQLRLHTTRQLGWQNGLRLRLSGPGGTEAERLDELFSPGGGISRPESCRLLAYAAREDGRLTTRWRRGVDEDGAPRHGDDPLALPATAALLRAAVEHPALTASAQGGSRWWTAMAVSAASPRDARGWLVACWDLERMCADPQLRLVSTDRALTARPLGGPLAPGEAALDIGEGEVRWRLAIGPGPGFGALFPRVSERAIALAGGGAAVLLALLAGLGVRASGLRADLAAQRGLVEMKDHLLQSVSHEFRTPLSVIISGAELLETYADRLTPERRAEALAHIREAAGRMNAMVEQVLLLSRIEARRVPMNPRPGDAAAFARAVAAAASAAYPGRRVEVDAPDALPAAFDPTLVRAVLENLLSNALKFSPESALVSLRVSQEGDRLLFTVLDHGAGISPADLARVREAFFRADSAAGVPGTGLGLTLADRCARLLGGSLDLASGPDGTTATLEIACPPCS